MINHSTRVSLGPFKAHNINLSGSDFVAGLPSPSIALGFVGTIARKLGESGWDHKAILIIHDLEENKGRVRGEQVVKSKRLMPVEVPETVTGQGLFTIIAEIPGHHDLNSITAAFMRLRFAGGAIFAQSGTSLPQVVKKVDDLDIQKTLSRLPRGMILSPPTDRKDTELVSFGEITSLEAIAMRAYSTEMKSLGGYVVPAPVGYRVLHETYTNRPPARCRDPDLPFALVDSAVGLAEYVSIRNRVILTDTETAFEKCGWSWACDGNLKMFSTYHLNAAHI
jgi:hypothetical protein